MTVRWSRDRAHVEFEKAPRSRLAVRLLPHRRRFSAAMHELRCVDCRVTWRSWWRRIAGDKRGFAPLGLIPHQFQESDDPPPPGRGLTHRSEQTWHDQAAERLARVMGWDHTQEPPIDAGLMWDAAREIERLREALDRAVGLLNHAGYVVAVEDFSDDSDFLAGHEAAMQTNDLGGEPVNPDRGGNAPNEGH